MSGIANSGTGRSRIRPLAVAPESRELIAIGRESRHVQPATMLRGCAPDRRQPIHAELVSLTTPVMSSKWLRTRSRAHTRVAADDGTQLRLIGLLGLEDAVREDSKAVAGAIRDAGVRIVMVTGDNALTARSVAQQVGIAGDVCSPGKLPEHDSGDALDCGVFARVLPEDTFKLVRRFQRRDDVVGMSGDGVNDAPALRQADPCANAGTSGSRGRVHCW